MQQYREVGWDETKYCVWGKGIQALFLVSVNNPYFSSQQQAGKKGAESQLQFSSEEGELTMTNLPHL